MTLKETMSAMSFEPVDHLTADQQFKLLAIRNQQIIRESSYSSHIIEDSEHLRWVERLKSDPSILFYAVLFQAEIVGGVGLRNINTTEQSAEWSFYVSKEAHGKGIGLALGVGALDLFFQTLCLKTIIGEALMDNPASLAYHEKLGFKRMSMQQHLVQPGNHIADIAVFRLEQDVWSLRRRDLLRVN